VRRCNKLSRVTRTVRGSGSADRRVFVVGHMQTAGGQIFSKGEELGIAYRSGALLAVASRVVVSVRA
jgi:hypothetical protein